MANRKGKNGSRDRFYFRGLWTVTAAMELKDACSSPFLTWPWWQGGWQNPWSTLPPSQARGSLGQPYVLSAHCSQEETGWWSAMRLGWSLSCPHHCPAFQGPMAEQPCPGGGRGLGCPCWLWAWQVSIFGKGPGMWGWTQAHVYFGEFFLKQLKSRNLSASWWTEVWILKHLCWPVAWDERE